MTSQKEQLQALIGEIDGVLSKSAPRLPWVMSGDMENQRRVLEQTRQYLASLEQQVAQAERSGLSGAAASLSGIAGAYNSSAAAESAQQVLQAVLQEMNYLRTHIMHPLRNDIDELQQKREALAQEVRLLEAQRQNYALPQYQAGQQQIIADFLQTLMGRLQENLTGQVAQMLSNLETQTIRDRALSGSTEAGQMGNAYQPMLTPTERLRHLQNLQSQSDQLLLKLDNTLQVIFESLQKNVHSYEDSLSQGLDKMHSLGQQGEAMFAALVNRLAQQLGREASTYLQSSIDSSEWEVPPRLPDGSAAPNAFAQFPYTGTGESSLSERQVDQLLSQPTMDSRAGGSAASNLPPLNLDNLDLEGGVQPFLTDYANDDDMTFLQVDQAVTRFQDDDDDDLTFFQMDEPITQLQSEVDLEESPEDLNSAFDLLEQLTTETPAPTDAGTAAPGEEEAIANPENLYGELNDLYESLFGLTGVGEAAETDEVPQDQHVADANQATPPQEEVVEDGELLADLMERVDDATEPDEAIASPAEERLFAGLSDPSEPDAALAEITAELATEEPVEAELDRADLADSLESFLFDEPVEAEETEEFFDADAIDGEEDLDEVSSLIDLIDDPDIQTTNSLASVLQTDPYQQDLLDEERYIPASPDENLLVTGESEVPVQDNLRLPSNTLQQLTTDLFSLEGLDQSELPPPDEDLFGIEAAEAEAASGWDAAAIAPETTEAPEETDWEPIHPDTPIDEIPVPPEEEPWFGESFGHESTEVLFEEPVDEASEEAIARSLDEELSDEETDLPLMDFGALLDDSELEETPEGSEVLPAPFEEITLDSAFELTDELTDEPTESTAMSVDEAFIDDILFGQEEFGEEAPVENPDLSSEISSNAALAASLSDAFTEEPLFDNDLFAEETGDAIQEEPFDPAQLFEPDSLEEPEGIISERVYQVDYDAAETDVEYAATPSWDTEETLDSAFDLTLEDLSAEALGTEAVTDSIPELFDVPAIAPEVPPAPSIEETPDDEMMNLSALEALLAEDEEESSAAAAPSLDDWAAMASEEGDRPDSTAPDEDTVTADNFFFNMAPPLVSEPADLLEPPEPPSMPTVEEDTDLFAANRTQEPEAESPRDFWSASLPLDMSSAATIEDLFRSSDRTEPVDPLRPSTDAAAAFEQPASPLPLPNSEPEAATLDDWFAADSPEVLFEGEETSATEPASEPLFTANSLESLFSDTPEAEPEVPPAAAIPSDTDATLDSFLDDLGIGETPASGDDAELTLEGFARDADEASSEGTLPDSSDSLDTGENAFTLEGLDNLFEDLPDSELPSSGYPNSTSGTDDFTLESAFADTPESPSVTDEGLFSLDPESTRGDDSEKKSQF